MRYFEYEGNRFEVEAKPMSADTLNVAFIGEDDFGLVHGWAAHADLSRIVLKGTENVAGEDGEAREEEVEEVYEGYTEFRALTALQATPYDFWEGLRLVVTLGKPTGAA